MALSKFAKFKAERVHRTQLKNATYNPRVLEPRKAKKLRANLEAVGLLEPIIWNKRTGNIVGGHQRLAALDMLEGTDDYELDVSAVDLDDTTEREQNVFLNNPEAQGDWDLLALSKMFAVPTFSIDRAGFDETALEALFEDADLGAGLAEPARAPDYAERKPRTLRTPELLVVFDSRQQREQFMQLLGVEADNRYVDAQRVLAALGVDPSEPWAQAYAER